MKVWCVACFRQEGAATIRGELYRRELCGVYVFSSLQKANEFLQAEYRTYEYDGYEIYEADVDQVKS